MENSNKHPKGLYVLFATEMWERFNYYGLRALLVLFIIKVFYFDKVLASKLYGSYTSLIFLTPLLGGFLSDKFWGNKKTIITGGLIMALGQLFLFFCASLATKENFSLLHQNSPTHFSTPLLLLFIGLGFMIAGNGFFKANISSLVGQLYQDSDKRKTSAYTIFYMGINLGGSLGPYICGLLGDTGNPADFRWGFLAGGIGMILSVLTQLFFHNKFVVDTNGQTLGLTPKDVKPKYNKLIFTILVTLGFSFLCILLLYIDTLYIDYLFYLLFLCIVSIAIIVLSDKNLDKLAKKKVIVIFIVSFFVIFFWSCYEQAGASLTFFAEEKTNRNINIFGFDYIIPTSWFQSVNATFIVLLAFIFAWLWQKLGQKAPNSFNKMAFGLLILALSFGVLSFGVYGIEHSVKVSMFWLISIYFMHTCGELLLSPIGMSLVNQLSPLKYSSLLMAVWFTSNASANKLAGTLSTLYPENGKITHFLGWSIVNLTDFFLLFMLLAGLASIFLFFIAKYLTKLAGNSNYI